MAKAVTTKDLGTMVMEAHGENFVTRIKLKGRIKLIPDMKTAFSETMDAVYEMTDDLIVNVESLAARLPTDGSLAEGAGSQALIELVKTGSAMIRQVTGLIEGAI